MKHLLGKAKSHEQSQPKTEPMRAESTKAIGPSKLFELASYYKPTHTLLAVELQDFMFVLRDSFPFPYLSLLEWDLPCVIICWKYGALLDL